MSILGWILANLGNLAFLIDREVSTAEAVQYAAIMVIGGLFVAADHLKREEP